MKKSIIAIVLLFSLAWGCQRKSAPTVADRTDLPTAPATAPAPVVSETTLAAGLTLYTGKCARCHEAKPVNNWTVDEWKPIMKSMAKKAKLDSLETAQVTLYVNANAKK